MSPWPKSTTDWPALAAAAAAASHAMMARKSFILVGRVGAEEQNNKKILLAAEMKYYFAKTKQTRDPRESKGEKTVKENEMQSIEPKRATVALQVFS